MLKSAGRYEIIAELGRGGFGQVYKALDPTVNRMVAVKVLAADGDADTLARFRNEAASSGRLHHPNIVTIYDFGEQDKVPYIVMELLEGQDLHHVISERKPLALWQKVQIMSQVATGLGHAHAHGIVHRDVKPANVMLLPNGNVKIMDFGIALISQSTHTRLTPRGAMIGTFRYMAPEQFRGLPQDPRSDIFAYGLMYYELLTGVHPFHATEAAAMMYNALNLEPVPIDELYPGYPIELQTILTRLLQKDPDFRYQNLEDVLFDSAPILLTLRRERAQELLEQAKTAKQQGLLEPAQGLIRQVLEMDPSFEGAREFREDLQMAIRRNAIRPRVEALVSKGADEMAAGSLKEAVQALESAIRLDPTDTHVRSLLEQARLAFEQSRKIAQLVNDADRALQARDYIGEKNSADQALALAPAEPQAGEILERAQAALAEQERQARLAEELLRAQRLIDIRAWHEAAELLNQLQSQYPEVSEVQTLQEMLRTGRLNEQRQNLLSSGLAAARQEIQAQDLPAANKRLQALKAEFADSADVDQLLRFVKSEIETSQRRETIDRSIEEARALLGQKRLLDARQVLEAALSAYPTDPFLQREFRAVSIARRRAGIQEALTAAKSLQSQGQLEQVLGVLQAFSEEFGSEPSIDELRESISNERKARRLAEDIRGIVGRANEFLAQGRHEEATQLLQAPPTDLRDHPELTKLLTVAKKQRERMIALEEILANANALQSEGRVDEALMLLQSFTGRNGPDPRVEEAQKAILRRQEEERRDGEIRGAVRRAKELLVQGNALEATRLLQEQPQQVRDNPEAVELLSRAQVDVAKQAERESALKRIISSATALRKEERFDDALAILEADRKQFGADPHVDELQAAIKQDRDALEQRVRKLRDALAPAQSLLSQQNWEGAIAFLRQAPASVRNHPEAGKLMQAAESALAAKNRKIAIDEVFSEVTALLRQESLEDSRRALERGLQRFPGEAALVALQSEIAVAEEKERSAALNRQAIAKVRHLLSGNRYEDAARAVAGALAANPVDPELHRLRAEVETLQRRWIAERAEQEIQEGLSKAQALLPQQPGEAVTLLDRLQQAYPGRQQIATGLAEAREAASRRELLNEVEGLCQRDDFAAALTKLSGVRPDAAGEIDRIRERVKSLESEVQLRRAAEAIRTAESLQRENPKGALAMLERLEQPLRARSDVRAAIDLCKAAIASANRGAAIARIEELCTRGKFAKARDGYKELVIRFGADAELAGLLARIEAATLAKDAQPVPQGILQKPQVRIGVMLGVIALLATGAWLLTRRGTTAPVALVPVEIRTDPPGASLQLGDRSCQTPNCQLQLLPGTYSVLARLNGYEPAQQQLTVDAATSPRLIDIVLKPIVAKPVPGHTTGTLVVQAGMSDALVFVDNVARGRTDASGRFSLPLEEKTYQVRVQKLGYEIPRDQQVVVSAKAPAAVSFSLSPQYSRLELRGAPAGVEVRAGSSILGRTDGSVFSAQVQPGDQTLQVTEGKETRQLQQRFEPGKTLTLSWANVAPPRVVRPDPVTKTVDIEEQTWEQARNTGDPARLQEYLDKYSNGPHAGDAQGLLENSIWSRTNRDDIASLRSYLTRYPRGPHAAEASSRIVELTWNQVEKRDEQAVRNYLGQNPDGPHRQEAQRLLDQFRVDAEAKKKNTEEFARLEAERTKLAADRQGVSAALGQYKQAYEARNIDALRAVYPSLAGNALRSLRDAFAHADSIQLDLNVVKEPEISGDSATVHAERSLRQTEGRKALAPIQGPLTIRLHRAGQAWVIDSIN
jgi:serine/threonine-protein kinase